MKHVGTQAGSKDVATQDQLAAANVAVITHAATSKTTPVDADELPIVDSVASWGLKKLTWANLKATLKTWLVAQVNSWSAAQTFSAGAAFGPLSPVLMTKLVTATTGASGVVSTSVAHGVDASKIVSVRATMSLAGGNYIPDGYVADDNNAFAIYCDAANVNLYKKVSTSAVLASRPFTVFVIYTP